MAYRDKDIKLLWGKAGGRCSFEGCNNELIVNDTNNIIGHIAHIVARSEDWTRGDPTFPKEQLDSYQNLILLCQHHHGLVDVKESPYTIDILNDMKAKHEQHVKQKLSLGNVWKFNISDLYYINIPHLIILTARQGFDLDLSHFNGIGNLYSLGFEFGSILQKLERLLEQLPINAISLESLTLSNVEEIGLTIDFNGSFHTKNLPKRNVLEKGFVLSGDLARDPHIYKHHRDIKLILTIDPRWITTSTSFSYFRSGRQYFAGLCMLKNVDTENKVAIGTPLIIGVPISPLGKFLLGDDI